MHGIKLLETIGALPIGVSAGVFLRHAERFPILEASDPTLAEITPNGAVAAEAFGGRLQGFDCVRIFHSPVKRCRQTAECIARGVGSTGCPVEIRGPEEALGVNYILDQRESGRLGTLHGEHFVRLWFSGQVAPSVICAAPPLAARKVAFVARCLAEPSPQGRRLDLHVSHDWNIIVLRELVCGVRHEEAGWLSYLDGVAFSRGADGLSAVYRDRTVTLTLPWGIASGDR